MPNLSIIPAGAVSDQGVTDLQLRVLCAIGTFTNRLGGNVWASVQTLAKACQLSPRSVQRAIPVLIERGYLRRVDRPGRTPIYEVLFAEGVTTQSPRDDQPVTPPPTTQSPKRSKERSYLTLLENPEIQRGFEAIWATYPKRPEAHPYVAFRKVILECVHEGASITALLSAARRYAQTVERDGTEARYVKSPMRFYGPEGIWRSYITQTVYGRTREEWARSGQDVLEFDRLAGEILAKETMSA